MSGFVGRGRAEVVLPEELTSVDAHREAMLATVGPLEALQVKVQDAHGLVLAEDIVADEPLPSFANSAMDGFALRAADAAGATLEAPVDLPVVGEVAAGDPGSTSVPAGSAVRVMTGAPVPPGADAVVPVERTSGVGNRVRIHVAPSAGDHIRPVGVDVTAGTQVLSAGMRLGAADVALLAALGRSLVRCVPQPRVVIISTGSELVAVGRRPGPGQLRDSNGPMLAAMVREAGALPIHGGIVIDDPSALSSALDSSTGHADLILTTGGVSAGAHDHLADVVARLGEAHPAKVAMKPGMPQLYGLVGSTPVVCLPGNPVSGFVSFEVFVRPLLRRMQGRRDLDRPRIRARLSQTVTAPPHKRSYVRVSLRREAAGWVATPTGHQGSHVLTSISRADGLAVVPDDVTDMHPGEVVSVWLLVQ